MISDEQNAVRIGISTEIQCDCQLAPESATMRNLGDDIGGKVPVAESSEVCLNWRLASVCTCQILSSIRLLFIGIHLADDDGVSSCFQVFRLSIILKP